MKPNNNNKIIYNWTDKTILIVDDTPVNRLLLKHMLDQTNSNLLFAKNSKEFYKYFHNYQNSSNIDLILMDIRLDENITGIDLIKYLNDNNINIPFIFQTAYEIEECEDFVKYLNYSYIRKPIDRNLLLRMINDIFTIENINIK